MSALRTSLAQSTLGALGFLGLQLTCEPPSSAFVFHLVFSEAAISLPSQSEATKPRLLWAKHSASYLGLCLDRNFPDV